MAKWRIGLAALTLAVLGLGLGLAPPALAQTYAPTFDLVVSGTVVQVTHDQTFDYGAHPPGASIVAQAHNGPNPECVFGATRSDTGASQYQNIGGSNGYDTTGHYTDPPPIVLQLPVPIVWTLTLACGQAGTIRATVSTELPPPPPPPSPSPAPGPTHATPRATPASPPKPTPSARRTPSVLGQATSRAPGQASPASSPSVPVSTPIVVTETPTALAPAAAPSPSSSASPSRSPSGSPLGAPRGPRGHGPDFLRFFLIAIGSVVALILILYAAGLRWVRVDEKPEDG